MVPKELPIYTGHPVNGPHGPKETTDLQEFLESYLSCSTSCPWFPRELPELQDILSMVS